MKTRLLLQTALLTFALTGVTGCMSKKNAMILPGADLRTVQSYYVVHLPADDEGINKLLSEDLNRRGYQSTTGEANQVPENVDALVTYNDKWMWDITMYLLQLDVQIRNPKTDMPLATGSVMHSSMARKTPKTMCEEVLDQIFTKAGMMENK